MGTITAQSIINKAAIQLTDIGNTRWTRAELLGYLHKLSSNNQITLGEDNYQKRIMPIGGDLIQAM